MEGVRLVGGCQRLGPRPINANQVLPWFGAIAASLSQIVPVVK